jgi:hypothetical protein
MIGIEGRDFQDPAQIGAFAALNDSLIVALRNRNAVVFNTKADAASNMVMAVTASFDDGVTFIPWPFRFGTIGGIGTTAVTLSASSQFALLVRAPGATHVQVKATSYTAGSVSIKATPCSIDVGSAGAQEVIGLSAQAIAVTGNPLQVAFESRLTARVATGDATASRPIVDRNGRVVMLDGQIRELTDNNNIVLSSVVETTLVPAVAAVFNDLRDLVIANTSAVDVTVDFRDVAAGPVRFSVPVKAGAVVPLNFKRLKQTTVNTSWTAQLSAAVVDVRILAISERTA